MSNDNYETFTSPVGRIVKGSVFEGFDKDFKNNPFVYKSGSEIGKPYFKFQLGIAIEKTNPDWPAFWNRLLQFHKKCWSKLFIFEDKYYIPGANIYNSQGQPTIEYFWKIIDGDSVTPDKSGVAPKDKEGYAGHWVITFTRNGTPPKACTRGAASMINDKEAINRGDYIRVVFSANSNEDAGSPGLHMNHQLVEFIGYGERIISGVDHREQLKENSIGYIPQAMQNTPPAPSTQPPVVPGGPQQQMMPPQQQQQQMVPPQQQQQQMVPPQQQQQMVPPQQQQQMVPPQQQQQQQQQQQMMPPQHPPQPAPENFLFPTGDGIPF